jgi:hypothetical protein
MSPSRSFVDLMYIVILFFKNNIAEVLSSLDMFGDVAWMIEMIARKNVGKFKKSSFNIVVALFIVDVSCDEYVNVRLSMINVRMSSGVLLVIVSII